MSVSLDSHPGGDHPWPSLPNAAKPALFGRREMGDGPAGLSARLAIERERVVSSFRCCVGLPKGVLAVNAVQLTALLFGETTPLEGVALNSAEGRDSQAETRTSSCNIRVTDFVKGCRFLSVIEVWIYFSFRKFRQSADSGDLRKSCPPQKTPQHFPQTGHLLNPGGKTKPGKGYNTPPDNL